MTNDPESVFEEAHTPANVSEPGKTDIPSAPTSLSGQIPTDDEREVIAQVILPAFDQLACAVYADGPYSEAESALEAVDLLIAAGFHRTVQGDAKLPENSVQGEPSDAQIVAALDIYDPLFPKEGNKYLGTQIELMRAALRAAAHAQGGETR